VAQHLYEGKPVAVKVGKQGAWGLKRVGARVLTFLERARNVRADKRRKLSSLSCGDEPDKLN
jgi:hypothetical protein